MLSNNNNSAAGEARLVEAAKEFQRRCKGNLQDLDDPAFAQVVTALVKYIEELESSAGDSANDISKENSYDENENDMNRVKGELEEREERGDIPDGSEVWNMLKALQKSIVNMN